MSSTLDNLRRRQNPEPPSNVEPRIATKQANAVPLLQRSKPGADPDDVSTPLTEAGTAVILGNVIPFLISWGTTMSLIFGGCCSNVRQSESPNVHRGDGFRLVTELFV